MYSNVLVAAQQNLLRQLGPLAREAGFYLGGGTAVAIQLGHRRSLDLGWFTGEPIGDPAALAARLRDRGLDITIRGVAAGTLHALSEGVVLSFLEYRYPLLQPPVHWEEFDCPLAPLEDLACMKLSALASRGSKKDFLDIYALGKTQFGLAEMLQLYRAKYATDDVAHVIMSLAYFDDAQQEEMPEMIWEVGWEQVERTLEGWVTDYTRRQIGGAE